MAFDPLSYTRRADGTTKGGGSFSNVVQYEEQREQSGSPITYHSTGANQGAFLIQVNGIYAVSVTAFNTDVAIIEIAVGASLINAANSVNTRAAHLESDSNPTIVHTAWTGFVPKGLFIYMLNTGTPNDFPELNQISISQAC